MGCFKALALPWRRASDLDGDAAAAHLEENFRMIDQWANPLDLDEGCQGSAPCVYLAAGPSNVDASSTAGVVNLTFEDVVFGDGNRLKMDAFYIIDTTASGVHYFFTSQLLRDAGYNDTDNVILGDGGPMVITWTGIIDGFVLGAPGTFDVAIQVMSEDASDFTGGGTATAIMGATCTGEYPRSV